MVWCGCCCAVAAQCAVLCQVETARCSPCWLWCCGGAALLATAAPWLAVTTTTTTTDYCAVVQFLRPTSPARHAAPAPPRPGNCTPTPVLFVSDVGLPGSAQLSSSPHHHGSPPTVNTTHQDIHNTRRKFFNTHNMCVQYNYTTLST